MFGIRKGLRSAPVSIGLLPRLRIRFDGNASTEPFGEWPSSGSTLWPRIGPVFTMFYIRCILNIVKGHERQIVEKGFEQDRLDYWAMRDELLAKYSGKWVAVHKGRFVAVADEPLSIMEQALAEDGYAYTNKVGEEDKIVIRQRRAITNNDYGLTRSRSQVRITS